ncbi:hypothetical protein SALBM135S_05193 [Streptomyces alboniger]
MVEKGDEGVSFGAPEKKLGIKGSPTREVYLDNVRIPADRMIGEEGTGFATAMQTLDHTRITIAAQALGIAHRAPWTTPRATSRSASSSASRSRTSRASSSCSPTWP